MPAAKGSARTPLGPIIWHVCESFSLRKTPVIICKELIHEYQLREALQSLNEFLDSYIIGRLAKLPKKMTDSNENHNQNN